MIALVILLEFAKQQDPREVYGFAYRFFYHLFA